MANIETLLADTRYYVEVAAPSTPSSGNVVTYAKSDGLMYSKDDAGTETLMSSGIALSNPMTTAGDIIKGGAAGVAERLAIGTAGQVLTVNAGATAPEWGTAGGGSGQGLVDFAFAKRTSGDIAAASSTWVDLGVTAIVLDAATGDVIEVGVSGVWNSEAVTGMLDVATIVSAAPVNYFGTAGGAGDFGVTGWLGTTGQVESIGGSVMYTLQAGDIDAATVTLDLRYRGSTAGTKTLRSQAALPFQWWAKNLGPAI
jgi:hypothetical protein